MQAASLVLHGGEIPTYLDQLLLTYAKEMPNIVASGAMMPGQAEVEHQPNEYIALDHLVNITNIYALDIYELAK